MEEQSDFKTHEESGLKYKLYTLGDESYKVFISDSNARLEWETFNEYKFRRSVNKYMNKQALKGRQFWPSVLPTKDGGYVSNTYNKERAERIKEDIINKQKQV